MPSDLDNLRDMLDRRGIQHLDYEVVAGTAVEISPIRSFGTVTFIFNVDGSLWEIDVAGDL